MEGLRVNLKVIHPVAIHEWTKIQTDHQSNYIFTQYFLTVYNVLNISTQLQIHHQAKT